MAFDLLPSLHPRARLSTIRVRVSRRWEYRGGTDDGPIGHVDLVLIDEKGNAMYAEIPGPEVEQKAPLILEGGVYVISRFRVSNAKSAYRPVPGQYMIEFTCYTRIDAVRGDAPEFPEYTYNLTPFADLPSRVGDTRNFIDVIGTLAEVSELRTVHLPNKAAPTLTRDIILMGLSNYEVKVTLWGHRASDFTIHEVYDEADPKPVIVLLVGCLMKSFQGQDYLSGNTACRWYFNPSIPEAEPFYSRLQSQRTEIRHVAAPAVPQVQLQPLAVPETKFLSELESIDPYDFPDNGYRCTVTIGRLVPGASWWFPCCNRCSKSCAQDGNGYRCNACSCTAFKFRYKLCFIATDGTAEAQMLCFGDIGRRVVGKPVQQVLRTARSPDVLPPDIASIVSLKFTFDIVLTQQSYYRSEKQYQVTSVVTAYGRQRALPAAPENTHEQPPNTPSVVQIHAGTLAVVPHTLVPQTSEDAHSSKTPPPPPDAPETPIQKAKASGALPNSTRPSARRRLYIKEDAQDETTTAPMETLGKESTGEKTIVDPDASLVHVPEVSVAAQKPAVADADGGALLRKSG